MFIVFGQLRGFTMAVTRLISVGEINGISIGLHRVMIVVVVTTSIRSSSNSIISTTNIRSICKDSHPKNPLLTFSDSTVLQHRRLQWLKVTILVNMQVPEVTAVNNTYSKATVVVG